MSKKLIYLVSFILVLSVDSSVCADLVGYWKFDEGSGTTAYDSSGNGLDGTLNGDPQWVEGQLGGALDFDGDDSVEIPHSPLLSITDEITITAWTYMRANASGEMAIVSKGGWAANDLPYELTEEAGSVIFWQFYDDGGRDTCAPDSPPVDEWHHIAATYDGQIFKCYIDGVLADEWGYAGTMPENTASVTIGQRSRGGTYFNGLIDDVQIYNRALSQEEVQTIVQDEVWPYAWGPDPADGAMHGDTWASLGWRAGDTAVSHDVYFGDDFDDVDDGRGGTFQGNQTATSFTVGVAGFPYPDGLILGTTYYWRIDEVEADGTTIHKGEVWSFTVSSMSAEEDFETNNFSTFPWEHHDDASWAITSYEKHSGAYSAQAGTIDHDERTTLQVLLDCTSGDITFYHKVSSEPGCDYLEFYIDGVKEGEWSSTTDWEQVSFPVRAGTRTFEWTYSKDGSVSEDDDTAWIDDIVFPTGADTIPTGEIIELTDATFNQTVLNSDVPVLVDFWAPWCGPCLTMAPVIEEIADEYAGKVKVCKLNVDNAPGTTTNYGIRFIPTFILFEDGQVQRQWVGVTGKNELTAAIDELL